MSPFDSSSGISSTKESSTGKRKRSNDRRVSGTDILWSAQDEADHGSKLAHKDIYPGDSVKLAADDDESTYFIGLVTAVHEARKKEQEDMVTVQWYYQAHDIPAQILKKVPDGHSLNEIFLSNYKDKNPVGSIICKCDVISKEDYDTWIQTGQKNSTGRPLYLCRFKYFPNHKSQRYFQALEEKLNHGRIPPSTSRIGSDHQAEIPKLHRFRNNPPSSGVQTWVGADGESEKVKSFMNLCRRMQFAKGNIARMFDQKSKKHAVCKIIGYNINSSVKVQYLDGSKANKIDIKDLHGKISEQHFLEYLYECQYDASKALIMCAQAILLNQVDERNNLVGLKVWQDEQKQREEEMEIDEAS